MTDFGTVISRFRSPAWITTSAVMTFTMLPIGRSVLRSRLHRTLPVAAFASAAPLTLIPDGPASGLAAAVGVAVRRHTALAAAGKAIPPATARAIAPTSSALKRKYVCIYAHHNRRTRRRAGPRSSRDRGNHGGPR